MGFLNKCEIILETDSPVAVRRRRSGSDIRDGGTQSKMYRRSDDIIMPDLKFPFGEDDVQKEPIVEMPEIADIDIKRTKEKAESQKDKNGLDFDNIQPLSESEELKGATEYADRRKGPLRSDRRRDNRVTNDNTLTVSDLRKNFGKKEVVRGVGFSMKGGDVAGLLGPNGAGKTTIFYMIVGFYKPTTGDIKLNNQTITSGPMYRRARMGIAYLPQEASIFRKLTVEQNIWAILESRTDINKKQKKDKLDLLIDDFGIQRIRKQFGYTLSGGERRRTEIARALAIEPKFLLLDEPFAGIDPIAVFEIKQIIKHLAQEGIGILITDHNVRDTLEITTDAFIINRGIIVARGDRDNILDNQTVRDVYLGSDFRM
ncbi:MAG: hypothetical protein Ta2G_10310 [Termitinemataceae bacterium]|nr:MAG: hypothetical protein Ta2G_10310 [Termitinemataceae bacterium]